MTILDPKGVIAASEKHLLILASLLMLIVVIPVIVLTFVFAWKYRASNTNAKYSPDWDESISLEVVWWAIPCVIIAILGYLTWTSTHKLDPYKPLASKTKPIIIQAIALEWKWLFIYPKQHIATVNYLQIPTHVPIRFLITSDAPMNSLEIPQLAGQIYAMTGMKTKLNLRADEPGRFTGLSTNFSGDGFSTMHFVVRATSEKQFNQWVKKSTRSPTTLTMAEYNKLIKPTSNSPVQYFSAPGNHIFDNAIMKYMGPDMSGMSMGGKHPNPPLAKK